MSRTDSQRKRIERIGKQFEANGFETYMPHQHLKEKAKLSKKNYNANRRNIDNAIIETQRFAKNLGIKVLEKLEY